MLKVTESKLTIYCEIWSWRRVRDTCQVDTRTFKKKNREYFELLISRLFSGLRQIEDILYGNFFHLPQQSRERHGPQTRM